jgi:ferritin-like metal-binding protein YciE
MYTTMDKAFRIIEAILATERNTNNYLTQNKINNGGSDSFPF